MPEHYILASNLFLEATSRQREAAVVVHANRKISILWGTASMLHLDKYAVAHVHPNRPREGLDPRLAFHPSESDLYFSCWRARSGTKHYLGWHAIISIAGVTVFHYDYALATSSVLLIPSLNVRITADNYGCLQIFPNESATIETFRIPITSRPMTALV